MFLETLPTNIKIGEISYPIRTDFRTWIKVESILKDNDIPDEFKLSVITTVCDLFFSKDISQESIDAIYDSIFSFWRMYKPINKKAKVSQDIAYSYEQDFDMIIAAFKQQYNIDILRTEMHWFEFKSLFDGLNDTTMFMKVVYYRTVDLNKVSKEQVKEYRELKEFYRIEDTTQKRTPQEIEAELLMKVGGLND